MEQTNSFREYVVPMTADDTLAIEKSIFGSWGKPKHTSLSVRLVILSFWIGIAYVVQLITKSWWGFGIALGLMVWFSLVAWKRRRDKHYRLNQAIRVGEVRVVEGIVEDHAHDLQPKKIHCFIFIQGNKIPVEPQHLELIRYGCKVQMRYQMTAERPFSVHILAYGDHDVEWTAPVEQEVEHEEEIGSEEKESLTKEFRLARIKNFVFLILSLVFLLCLCTLIYFFVHPLAGALVGLMLLYLLRNLPKMTGLAFWQPIESFTTGKKQILEGVLVAHELEINHKRRKQHFWTIGTRRIPVSHLLADIAEPGDRVKVQFLSPLPQPYKIERVQKRAVDWTANKDQTPSI